MSVIKMKRISLQADDAAELSRRLAADPDFIPLDKGQPAPEGFVRSSASGSLIERYQGLEGFAYQLRDPRPEDPEQPPTQLRNNWFNRPFGLFVAKHGLPAYYDLDPTGLLAISFCLLFGIMFGDIGQGIVLIIVGLAYARKRPLAAILSRAGLFSVGFGWLYGSLFGNEELIPEWMAEHGLEYWRFGLLERQNTETLLLIMAGLGALMTLAVIFVNILNRLRRHERRAAILEANGLAGLAFYGSLALLSAEVLAGQAPSWLIGLPLCLAGALMIIFSDQLGKHTEPGGKRFAKAWHYGPRRLWRALLGFAGSTMAFLMVGCFALAHAALMSAVYYLAGQAPAARIAIIVLGNALVAGIEATEVWHECLQLEYSVLYPRLMPEVK